MNSKKMTKIVLSCPSGVSLPASAGALTSKATRRRIRKNNKGGATTSAPVATTRQSRNSQATIQSIRSSDGRIRVRHREYIAEVVGYSDFTTVVFPIQPAMPSVFPWLSGIARLYESYIFQDLQFDFETSCGTSSIGTVMMAVDYDAFDYPPVTKAEFLMQHSAIRSSPWSPVSLRCDKKDLLKLPQRYTRQDVLADNLDLKTYDVGQLQVATSGCTNGQTLGELYVTYVVDLLTPQPPVWPIGGREGGDQLNSAGTVTKVAPYGDAAPAILGGTEMGVSKYDMRSLKFSRPGEFLVNWALEGAGIVDPIPVMDTDKADLSRKVTVNFVNDTSDKAFVNAVIKVISTPALLAAPFNNLGGTLTSLKTTISPFRYSLPVGPFAPPIV